MARHGDTLGGEGARQGKQWENDTHKVNIPPLELKQLNAEEKCTQKAIIQVVMTRTYETST